MKRKSLIFVISAPSGGGKTTICHKISSFFPELKRSVSLTTRQQRQGERSGIDYRFVSRREFLSKIKKGAFAEWAKVLDNYYGTLKKNIEAPLKQGKDVILNIDVQGALQIKKIYPQAALIFILPPSLGILRKRLKERKTDAHWEIKKRLKLARKELKFLKKYDYMVINDSLQKATEKIRSIIISERCRIRK